MPYRMTFRGTYSSMSQTLTRLTADLATINRQVATGKKVEFPSDDPVAMVTIMNRQRTLRNIEQYQRNLTMADIRLKTGSTSLENLEDIVARARTLAEQMATDTITASNRQAAAGEVSSLISSVINLGNTKIGEAHVFAGDRVETTPFDTSFYINTPIADENNASDYCGIASSSGTYYHGHARYGYDGAAADDELYFFAQEEGSDGNSITLNFLDTGALSVAVVGNAITVNIDGATTTAADIKAAIEADTEASALVAVKLKDGSTGSGLVSGLAPTNLSGGTTATSRRYIIDVTTEGAAGPATLTTTTGVADAELRFTAATSDGAGDSISITYLDPVAAASPLSVSAEGRAITVSLATDGLLNITSTAQDIMNAINADADASALVSAALAPDNDGAGVVTAVAETHLAYNGRQAWLNTDLSGADNDFKLTANAFGAAGNNITLTLVDTGALAVGVAGDAITVNIDAGTTTATDIINALNADAAASALITASLVPGNDGTGTPSAMAATNLSGGAAQAKFRVGEYVDGTTTWGADDAYAADSSAVQIFEEGSGEYLGVKAAFSDSGLLKAGDQFYIDAGYYRGGEVKLYTNIGATDQIQHNIIGTDALGEAGGSDNVLDILREFEAYLNDNDVEGVQSMIVKLNDAREGLVNESASVGARINRLAIRNNMNKDFSLTATDNLAEIEGADLTEVLVELNMKQLAYQAALTSIARITSLSLLDYL